MGDAGAVLTLAWVQAAGPGKGLSSHWHRGNPVRALRPLGAPRTWLIQAAGVWAGQEGSVSGGVVQLGMEQRRGGLLAGRGCPRGLERC